MNPDRAAHGDQHTQPAVRFGARALFGAAALLAVTSVAVIGFSRIALGVHYLSDVVAGYVLGAAWVAAMVAAFNAWRSDGGTPTVAPADGLEPEHESRIRRHDPRLRDPSG